MPQAAQKRNLPFKVRAIAFLLCNAVRALYATLRLTVRREAEVDALCQQYGSVILVTWHGGSLIPIARSVGKGYFGMVSLSRDGDLLNECFRRLGWRTIRGSTGKAGVRAMKAALDIMEEPGTVLAITPDGPRGPACKVQPGAVFLAQKSGRPILPVGIGMRHPWHAKSWDRFRIPFPFSQVVWLYGNAFFVSPEDDIEQTCLRLEAILNELEAEAMAACRVPNPNRRCEHAETCPLSAIERGQENSCVQQPTDGVRPVSNLPSPLRKWAEQEGLQDYHWQQAPKATFLAEEDEWRAGNIRLTHVRLDNHPTAYYAGLVSETSKVYYWFDGWDLPDLGDWSITR